MYTGPEKTEWYGPHHCKFAIRPPTLAESELPRIVPKFSFMLPHMRNQLGWCVNAAVEERSTFSQLEQIIRIEISWKEVGRPTLPLEVYPFPFSYILSGPTYLTPWILVHPHKDFGPYSLVKSSLLGLLEILLMISMGFDLGKPSLM